MDDPRIPMISGLHRWLSTNRSDFERQGYAVTLGMVREDDHYMNWGVSADITDGTRWVEVFCWEKGDFEVHWGPNQHPTNEEYKIEYHHISSAEEGIDYARPRLQDLTGLNLS